MKVVRRSFMEKKGTATEAGKKKLVLRRESIRALDNVDLSLVAAGRAASGTTDERPPPDTNHPTEMDDVSSRAWSAADGDSPLPAGIQPDRLLGEGDSDANFARTDGSP